MPKWRSYDFRCQDEDCSTTFDTLVDISPDAPASEGPDEIRCPVCDFHAERIPSVPNVKRKSFHDGKDRGDGYRKLKEAARLEVEAAGKKPSERADIRKEISRLKSTSNK